MTGPVRAVDAGQRAPQLVALAPQGLRGAAPPRAMPICSGPVRRNCVVDGDTFWLDGEKFRIETIDAPELSAGCARERRLAERATRRLAELVSGVAIDVARSGPDRYGRTLAKVRGGARDVGAVLVAEGLASVWGAGRRDWCRA